MLLSIGGTFISVTFLVAELHPLLLSRSKRGWPVIRHMLLVHCPLVPWGWSTKFLQMGAQYLISPSSPNRFSERGKWPKVFLFYKFQNLWLFFKTSSSQAVSPIHFQLKEECGSSSVGSLALSQVICWWNWVDEKDTLVRPPSLPSWPICFIHGTSWSRSQGILFLE